MSEDEELRRAFAREMADADAGEDDGDADDESSDDDAGNDASGEQVVTGRTCLGSDIF